MAALVLEDAFLVRYETWSEWRRAKWEQYTTEPELVEPDTQFCGECWGQGKIWEPAGNGEGLVPRVCLPCLGRGVVHK